MYPTIPPELTASAVQIVVGFLSALSVALGLAFCDRL
jgi:hypothetical protein